MSEEIAWAVADIAYTRRLQRQLVAHRELCHAVAVFESTLFPELLTPLQRVLWADVRAKLTAADASVGAAGGGGGEVRE